MDDLDVKLDAIFKAYDIRGLVGEQIDADVCRRIGAAFAGYVRSGAAAVPRSGAGAAGVGAVPRSGAGAAGVVVGRDMRPDGLELSGAFVEGVTGSGLDVVDIGLCSTEMAYFASGLWGMPAAMFTASHNPAGHNGIKLCGPHAAPIGSTTGLDEIKERARALSRPCGAPGRARRHDLLDEYVAHVVSFVEPSALRPLRIVVDSANGMGGLVVPAVFACLPFELDHLYPELDGTFPNHPADPLQSENQQDLRARVQAVSADAGLAFDGDADRVFVVDERARSLPGSLIAALIARVMLRREPGAAIVHNPICSRALAEVVGEWGGRAVRSRVGHSFMKQSMAATGAVFGGEHSGHYYFRDNYGADGAMIAAVLLLEALSRHDGALSDLVAPLERYASSGEINTEIHSATVDPAVTAGVDAGVDAGVGAVLDAGSDAAAADEVPAGVAVGVDAGVDDEVDAGAVDDVDTGVGAWADAGAVDPAAVIERVAAYYAAHRQDRLDGLTVDCGDWWFNLRPSNTEPLLRLNLEAETPAAVAARVAEVRGMLQTRNPLGTTEEN